VVDVNTVKFHRLRRQPSRSRHPEQPRSVRGIVASSAARTDRASSASFDFIDMVLDTTRAGAVRPPGGVPGPGPYHTSRRGDPRCAWFQMTRKRSPGPARGVSTTLRALQRRGIMCDNRHESKGRPSRPRRRPRRHDRRHLGPVPRLGEDDAPAVCSHALCHPASARSCATSAAGVIPGFRFCPP